MVAFQRAVEVGVDALELDVHLTRDNVFVVAHDDDALRMCGAQIVWREVDIVEALRLDAGWGFVAKDGSRPFAGQRSLPGGPVRSGSTIGSCAGAAATGVGL